MPDVMKWWEGVLWKGAVLVPVYLGMRRPLWQELIIGVLVGLVVDVLCWRVADLAKARAFFSYQRFTNHQSTTSQEGD